MRERRFEAVLFDVGGTLWTGDGPSRVQAAAQQLGAFVTPDDAGRLWDEIAAASRTPAELAKSRDLTSESHRRCWIELLNRADVIAPGMGQLLYDQEFQPESVVVYQDVPETLDLLRRRGLRLGVVSDVGLDIRTHLAHHALLEYFGTCVLSYEHGAVKPDPRLFRTACNELGVAPEATLMVGDNAQADGGAVDAGLTALILPAVQRGSVRGLDACIALVSTQVGD